VGAVGEYYRRANAADTDRAFAEAVPELAHSLSPLPRVAEDIPGALGEARGLAVVDGAVVERDVGAERIRGISEFLAGSLSDADTDTLAGDNAVVAVTLEAERVVGGRLAKEWLVAPEDGAWRLVWLDGRNSPQACCPEKNDSQSMGPAVPAGKRPAVSPKRTVRPGNSVSPTGTCRRHSSLRLVMCVVISSRRAPACSRYTVRRRSFGRPAQWPVASTAAPSRPPDEVTRTSS